MLQTTTVLIGLLTTVSGSDERGQSVDFNRDVRPILSAYCFKCHGPDEKARQAGLRLDQPGGLYGKRENGIPFVPGDAVASLALHRINSADPGYRMPPPETKKSLSADQIEVLTAWVRAGAKWSRHWSFEPPVRPNPPQVRDPQWVRGALDAFVRFQMEQRSLVPSPQADSVTLIRRLYLDLIGFGPAPAEVDYWLKQFNVNPEFGYEKLVDQLLASPRYGERWGRRWLDLARYADTNGYEKDRERSIWPFRDWVIDALNRDMPFDQFTIEQVAGDMIAGASLSQHVATGFHRNTMLNEEGGIDPLEFRFHAMTDRMATTGMTWVGLTLGCAQCHSHKFDPISQREYYRLMAYLNNADEPSLDLPNEAVTERRKKSLKEARSLIEQLPSLWPKTGSDIQVAYETWLSAQRQRARSWHVVRPSSMDANLALLELEPDGAVFASGDTAKVDIFQLSFDFSDAAALPVAPIYALRIEALPDARLPEHGPGTTYYEGTLGDFFLTELQIRADGKPVQISDATESYAKNRFGANPVSAKLAVDSDIQTGWSVHGRQGERHTAVFQFATPLRKLSRLELRMTFGRHFASSLGRFRISISGRDKLVAQDMPESLEDMLLISQEKLDASQHDALWQAFLVQSPQLAKHTSKIIELRKRIPFPTTLVMRERPPKNPRSTQLHRRGEFLQPADPVQRGIPSVLAVSTADPPKDRLEFARWLVGPKNPLAARVLVNRHWAYFFGRGIVRTLADFGFQGQPPTHPALLDWLAVEFMNQGWSVKRLHRLIVLSATYRQSSELDSRGDEQNHWFTRAARIRLDAEVIRDSILSASGTLCERVGGPPVKPPQPPGVTEAAYGKSKWVADQGANRYRRSCYTFLKRTAPFAMYLAFDAPSGEACVAKRNQSNTAIQALTILNDEMFLEAARSLGMMTARRPGDDEQRATFAFRRLLARAPNSDELRLLIDFIERQRARFRSGELDPEAVGAADSDQPIEQASWTALARVLFALDETVTRP